MSTRYKALLFRVMRGIIRATCLVVVLAAVSTVATHASAQVDTGADPDAAEHAAQDLANVPITTIEAETAANKAMITARTGVVPGLARAQQIGQSLPTISPQAVSSDPGISGSWSPVIDTQVVPVFQAVLPDGKVLMWDSVGDNATETYANQTYTRAMVWNPTNNTFKRVDVVGSNIFCAGFAHMANGNILVAGGNKDQKLDGLNQTHIFNWKTETWSRGPDMAAGRWYPSVTEMANGEATIIGGGPALAEVYQINNTIRPMSGFTNTTYGQRLYPYMMSRPDTSLAALGGYTTMYTINTSGLGMVLGTSTRDSINRDYGSFAPYDIGKALVVGGGNITENGLTNVPTNTAVTVDTNSGTNPVVKATSSMSNRRRQFNATVLADGSVLATGGETSAATSPLVDLDHAVTSAERWNPATGTWTTLASASRIRQYHSTATLLPDGRVLTGGGGVCATCMQVGYLEKNIEYFTPPYLYKKDGSGQLAARPVISTAPATIKINTAFTLTSSQASAVKKVALIGFSDDTHDDNQGQRYVPLKYTVSGTTITAVGPATGGITPPGYYMLVIVDSNGVPSVAKTVQVAMAPAPLMSPVKNVAAARCVDDPGSSITARTVMQIYPCNNTRAQALTRLAPDNSIRVLGFCMDVKYSHFVTGQPVWMYTCNNTGAQHWRFYSDGTIRPISATSLCLTPKSTATKAQLMVATCKGTTLQKWTW